MTLTVVKVNGLQNSSPEESTPFPMILTLGTIGLMASKALVDMLSKELKRQRDLGSGRRVHKAKGIKQKLNHFSEHI